MHFPILFVAFPTFYYVLPIMIFTWSSCLFFFPVWEWKVPKWIKIESLVLFNQKNYWSTLQQIIFCSNYQFESQGLFCHEQSKLKEAALFKAQKKSVISMDSREHVICWNKSLHNCLPFFYFSIFPQEEQFKAVA